MIARIAALVLVAAVTLGSSFRCSSGDPLDPANPIGPSFAATLELRDASGAVRDSFQRGEPITFELSVRNRRASEVVVQFPSARQFDFVVLAPGTRTVRWKWSTGRLFAQAVTEIVFAPGETKVFRATWPQLDDAGQLLPTGTYEARGVLVFPEFDVDPTAPNEMGSTLRQFTIR